MTTISSTERLAQLTGSLSQTLLEISTLLTDAAGETAAPVSTEEKTAPKAPAKKTSKSQATPTPAAASPKAGAATEASSEEERKPITMIELRDLLNRKSQDGFTAEVKALIVSYGVKKLSQIPEEKYPEVYAAAEKITKEA
jgi:hypothetical protein